MQRLIFITLVLLVAACGEPEKQPDAYGNFEATEVMLSSEQAGKLLMFNAKEGEWLESGQLIAAVDTTPLLLKRQQVLAQIEATLSQTQDVASQLAVYDKQMAQLEREVARVEKLVAGEAATPQQLDDLKGQLDVLRQKKEAHLTQLQTANRAINQQVKPLQVQVRQLDDQIARCRLVAPFAGQVLTTYAEPYEIVSPGRPLLKLADTRELTLRAFVSGSQLSDLTVGQTLEVLYDQGENDLGTVQGTLAWISPKAEFTPRTIQTRDERTDLVYAVKIRVPNEGGSIKIGMPGEARF